MKELTYTITSIEPVGPNLHVNVAWEVVEGEGRETVLVDQLALPLAASKESIEKAIELRAESYVRPRYIDPPPAPREDLASLIGQEKRLGRPPEKPADGGRS